MKTMRRPIIAFVLLIGGAFSFCTPAHADTLTPDSTWTACSAADDCVIVMGLCGNPLPVNRASADAAKAWAGHHNMTMNCIGPQSLDGVTASCHQPPGNGVPHCIAIGPDDRPGHTPNDHRLEMEKYPSPPDSIQKSN